VTNIYTCKEWNVAAQDYKPIECPENEEAAGAPETAKKFTQQEVMQQLTKARQAAQKASSPPAAGPATSAATNVREVGLVLPSHIRPGERISGSVVEDPAAYEGMPQITVTRFALPFAGSGNGSTLAGWRVETSGEPPQPADGPIELNVPPGQVELAVMFRAADREGAPVSKGIPITPSKNPGKASTSYLAPATCIKGQLCMVSGPFSGNSSKSFAAFMDQPARIIAETTTAAYIAIPDAIEPGQRPLAISEGSKAIAFPTVVSKVGLRPDRRDLKQGEQFLMYLTVDGIEEIPEEEWRPGNFPPWSLEEARKLIPGYQLPRGKAGDHEAKEKAEHEAKGGKEKEGEGEEDPGGEILLVVKNTTPGEMSFRESKNGEYVFRLHAPSFKMGEYKYEFVVEAKNAGTFGVQKFMIPFLAPLKGQEFEMTEGSH
jgi:hypothetical protein